MSYKQLAKQNKKAYKDLKMIKTTINKQVNLAVGRTEEYKWFGSGIIDTAVYSGLGYGQLNMLLIPQGATDSTRMGDRLKLKSLHLNIRLKGPQSLVAPHGQAIRVIVFQYKAPSTTAVPLTPNINQIILQDVVTGVRSALSFRDIDHKQAYTMLYDKTFTTNSQLTAVGNAESWLKVIKTKIPLKYAKKDIQYSAGGKESSNPIWVGFIGSEPTFGAGANATIGLEWRVRFTDS